jgi:glycerophosphoryl diester phosphodiesterase
MELFHSIQPSVPVGVLFRYKPHGIRSKEIKKVARYATYLNPKVTLINKRLLRRIHRHGMKSVVWTIRTKSEAKRIKHLPVDGIVTDFLDYLD